MLCLIEVIAMRLDPVFHLLQRAILGFRFAFSHDKNIAVSLGEFCGLIPSQVHKIELLGTIVWLGPQ